MTHQWEKELELEAMQPVEDHEHEFEPCGRYEEVCAICGELRERKG